ncbi:unnamed protein product, partial [Choristocarpus tenellus]
TLAERLQLQGGNWLPPPLRALPRCGKGFFSGWTHVGPVDRFELVKSVNRQGKLNDRLSDIELEWAVLCLEEAEACMAFMEFSTAAGLLERVLDR